MANTNFKLLLIVYCLLLTAIGSPAWAVPDISNVEITSISEASMVVTWTTSNEAASTEIYYGAGGISATPTVISAGTTKYHYAEITGLTQNTIYQFRLKSGTTVFPPALFSPLEFTTLEKPTGEYLFSFAVLNDLRFADFVGGKSNTSSARGIPYESGAEIIASEVDDINAYEDANGDGVAFTVINGNLADEDVTYGTQISTTLKGYLEVLNGASEFTVRDPGEIAYKYMPVPGYHDKKAGYGAGNDWIKNSFNPLTSQTSIESVYGYDTSSSSADSVFNYSFEYNNYNFIFLDSITNNSAAATTDTDFVKNKIAGSLKKTFIFMSTPAYDPTDADTKDYALAIPTSEVGGGMLAISNAAAFRATLEAFEDASGNPTVAAVISGQLGDNFKREINDISYVRQGPAIQYPTGYSIYKVYSTGYTKTFYKTTDRDSNDKPYYELARDRIIAETVSGSSIPAAALTSFWLGSASSRNFSYQYAFIPGLAPRVLSTGPVSAESGVSLNSPILISFNKRMTTALLGTWVSIVDNNSNTLAVSAESFIDASRTILKVTHPDFTADKTYTVTIDNTKAKDEGLTQMALPFTFSFNTNGGTKDLTVPEATLTPITNNTTTDPFPVFIGIATDESRIINVEYRFDDSTTWITAEAVDGEFTGVTEVFQIKATNPLSDGTHEVWLRTSDGIGNTTITGFSAYVFTVALADRPSITAITIDGTTVYSGDSISPTPNIEVTITSNTALASVFIDTNSGRTTLSYGGIATTYYATHEVTTALADGTYCITIEAFDAADNAITSEVYPLYVQSAAAATIQGTPLNNPNPFDPGTQTTTIAYSLSKPSTVTLSLFDLAGNLVYKETYTASESGGKAGYNEVTWDGKSSAGDYVGTGIYIYLIIVDGKVPQNGKGKITVFKQ
ncbi:Ig-like domain-containing protein [Candidatus Margulisiibacteriota bacterium]